MIFRINLPLKSTEVHSQEPNFLKRYIIFFFEFRLSAEERKSKFLIKVNMNTN